MAKKLFPDGTEVVPFYVRAITSGPFVFVSGTTSLDAKGRVQGKDAAEQTKVTMRKIEAALKSAGSRLADLTRMTIFVTDIRDMAAVTKALATALKGSVVTSTLVAVSALAVPGLLVEIDGRRRALKITGREGDPVACGRTASSGSPMGGGRARRHYTRQPSRGTVARLGR